MQKYVTIHGHRGSRGTSPENTLPSFQHAADAGVEWVEFDIRFSKDKELVVFHDYDISGRICRDAQGKKVVGSIPVKTLTVTELKTFDCGAADARIPTFRDLIEWKLKHAPKLRLNTEIKFERERDDNTDPTELARAATALLNEYKLIGESLIQSFDFDVVRALRRLEPQARLSCLFENEADFAEDATENQAQVAAVHHTLLTAENVKKCQAKGLEVLPWTVNAEADWIRMIQIGVTSIITDYPKKLSEFKF